MRLFRETRTVIPGEAETASEWHFTENNSQNVDIMEVNYKPITELTDGNIILLKDGRMVQVVSQRGCDNCAFRDGEECECSKTIDLPTCCPPFDTSTYVFLELHYKSLTNLEDKDIIILKDGRKVKVVRYDKCDICAFLDDENCECTRPKGLPTCCPPFDHNCYAFILI